MFKSIRGRRVMLKKFDDLKGLILANIENIDDSQLIFTLANGEKYQLYHNQDCCESVYIEDINGDLLDLVGTPLLQAEEACSDQNPEDITKEYQDDSFTWTFYKLATIKGYVTIRWYGESNGYYSESVDFGPTE